jgi:hypothetical protein
VTHLFPMLRFSTSAACCRVQPDRESVRQRVAPVRGTTATAWQQPRVWRTSVITHFIFELNLARKEDCSQPASRDSFPPTSLCDLPFTSTFFFPLWPTMANRFLTQRSTRSRTSWPSSSAASHAAATSMAPGDLRRPENFCVTGHGPTRSLLTRLSHKSRSHASTVSFDGTSAKRRHFWSSSPPARHSSDDHPPLRAGVMPVFLRGTLRSGSILHRSPNPATPQTTKGPGLIVSPNPFFRTPHGGCP